jgi:hypothetical protein
MSRVWTICLAATTLGASACATSGAFRVQVLTGGGTEASSYTYLEVIDVRGEPFVANAVEARDPYHTKVLGGLEPPEVTEVHLAASSGGFMSMPQRFGPRPPLKSIEAPEVGSSWHFTARPDEEGVFSIEETKDLLGTPVYAFVVKTPDNRRSGWVTAFPSENLHILRIATLSDESRIVVQTELEADRNVVISLEVVDLGAGLARLLDAEGVARMREKHFDEAREFLERALTLSSDDATARYNLACLFSQIGQPEAAMRELSVALYVDTTHDLANTARNDPDLASLGSRPDFKRLVNQKTEVAAP